jgi:hypothetical protein
MMVDDLRVAYPAREGGWRQVESPRDSRLRRIDAVDRQRWPRPTPLCSAYGPTTRAC